MSEFPHLPLKDSFKGDFRFKGTSRKPNPRTLENRNNSRDHDVNNPRKAYKNY